MNDESLTVHRAEIRKRLADENIFATELLLIVLDVYGERAPDGSIDVGNSEVLEWLPNITITDLEFRFDVRIPESSIDKLGAACSLITTNYFFKDVTRFIDICNALSGSGPNPEYVDLADADEVLWGVYEASQIYPPDPEDEDDMFNEEIEGYIRMTLAAEGLDYDLTALGTPVSSRSFGTGDPVLEEAMGAASYEASHEVLSDLSETINKYKERLASLPLRMKPTTKKAEDFGTLTSLSTLADL